MIYIYINVMNLFDFDTIWWFFTYFVLFILIIFLFLSYSTEKYKYKHTHNYIYENIGKGDFMIKWTATIWRTGGSFVVTVPADFVKHSKLSENKEYRITLEEVLE